MVTHDDHGGVAAPAPGETLLALTDVGVRFGGLKAVDGVSFDVEAGERRAIIGPNGAGKTTLFNAISGMVPPTSGRIEFGKADITRVAPHRRAALGISRTFQITNLFPSLSVQDNMQIALRGLSPRKFSLLGTSAMTVSEQERFDRALRLSRIGASAGTLVQELSYGEQRQVELAMALVTEPKLLLLDEPAAGLSPSERSIVADIIRGLPRSITVILIEHDMDLVMALVDRITCLNNGRYLTSGSPAEIRSNREVQDVYLGKARVDA